MKAVIQRVGYAKVTIDGKIKASIEEGLLVLFGVEEADTDEDIEWLSAKVCNLRIFSDEKGVMNLSVKEINGEVLIVSQFTLHASTKKGNRPSYIRSAKPEIAIPLYEKFILQMENDLGPPNRTDSVFQRSKPVQTGTFGADMKVELLNDGHVTIVIDTKNKE